jgi:60 kDa SS-A/Ro ribonucleoprotein
MRTIRPFNKVTPQSVPVPGRSDMISNSAGGYGFEVSLEEKVWRFLIMGSESTYYNTGEERTLQALDSLVRLTDRDPKLVVDMAVKVSVDNISPSNDYALFALAFVLSNGDNVGKRYAASRLNEVARIGTHLFTFVHYATQQRGWGKVLRDAVAGWYTSKNPNNLAYQVLKYKQRGVTSEDGTYEGYSHRDLLRLSHVKDTDGMRRAIYHYITKGASTDSGFYEPNIEHDRSDILMKEPIHPGMFLGTEASLITSMEAAKSAPTEAAVIALIRSSSLTHEMIGNEWKNSPKVWEALLERMPVTATMRNLAKMTQVGLIAPGSWDTLKLIRDRLTSEEVLKKARVHPLSVLKAAKTYNMGHGYRGTNTWSVVPEISEILEGALYASFGCVPVTGKKYILGVDVSGSMSGWGVGRRTDKAGRDIYNPMEPLTPAEIAMTMAYITYRREPLCIVLPFAKDVKVFDMSRYTSLYDFLAKTRRMTYGSTDVSAPIRYAIDNGIDADIYSIYCDYETWVGEGHPYQWLQKYREKTGINAGYVGIGINPRADFSLADPRDPRMVDIQGFDPGVPGLIARLATGELAYNQEAIRNIGSTVVDTDAD